MNVERPAARSICPDSLHGLAEMGQAPAAARDTVILRFVFLRIDIPLVNPLPGPLLFNLQQLRLGPGFFTGSVGGANTFHGGGIHRVGALLPFAADISQ